MEESFSLVFLLVISVTVWARVTSSSTTHPLFNVSNEHRLLRRTFDIYGDGCEECKLARPIESEPETMQIEFGIALIQVVELDEKRQTMTTHLWEYHVWHDNRLAWNTSDYGGLNSVNPPKDKIWNPSITLYNVIDRQSPYDHPLNVWHTGEVLWVTQAIYKSPCDVKTYNFPFDVHVCNFTFASWTHSEQQLNLTFYQNQEGILMMQYYHNPQWEIQNTSMDRVAHYYQCCPDPFIQLIYSFTLRRRVAFFAFVLILPSVLLSMLTLVIFCLPPDSTDKINIGLSIFLSYFVLLMILVESTPTSGQAIPLLGQYFCVSLVIIAMSVISSTFIINIYGKRTKDPYFSKKVRAFMEILAKLLLVQGPWTKKRKSRKLQKADVKVPKKDPWYDSTASVELLNHHHQVKDVKNHTTYSMKSTKNSTTPNPDTNEPSDAEELLNGCGLNRERGSFKMALKRGLGDYTYSSRGFKDRALVGHMYHDYYYAHGSSHDWMLLASLLDRLFFFVYFVINVIAASVIFTQAIP